MRHIEAVLFDLDGTLLDTAPDFALVMQQLCEEYERLCPDDAAIRNTVSHGSRALVTLAFDMTEQDPEFDGLRERLLHIYSEKLAVHTSIFPGMEQSLEYLQTQGIDWGIVTNKPSAYAEPLLKAIEFDPPAGVLVCPDHVTLTKPHPEPLLAAARHLGCTASRCVYVGDHRRDIEAGAAAGMYTVAALYGYIDPADPAARWQADYSIERPEQLIDVLKRIELEAEDV